MYKKLGRTYVYNNGAGNETFIIEFQFKQDLAVSLGSMTFAFSYKELGKSQVSIMKGDLRVWLDRLQFIKLSIQLSEYDWRDHTYTPEDIDLPLETLVHNALESWIKYYSGYTEAFFVNMVTTLTLIGSKLGIRMKEVTPDLS